MRQGVLVGLLALLLLALPLSVFATPYALSSDFVVLVSWAFVLERSERCAPGQQRLLRPALLTARLVSAAARGAESGSEGAI